MAKKAGGVKVEGPLQEQRLMGKNCRSHPLPFQTLSTEEAEKSGGVVEASRNGRGAGLPVKHSQQIAAR